MESPAKFQAQEEAEVKNTNNRKSESDTPKAETHPNREGDSSKSFDSPAHPKRAQTPPHNQTRGGTRCNTASPMWERKVSSDGSHAASSTPGRSRLRQVNLGDESPDDSTAVPVFGDWDDSNPASAEGYSNIFNKVREEKHGGGGKSPRISSNDTTFYGQRADTKKFYHSGADGDGRMSPFHSTGPTKFNENVPMLSSQEVGNSLMLSAAGPTPVASQTGAVTQGSIAVTQQPLPVFRQPTGVHLSHYPPNFMPYGPYFSPYYVHPPPIHQFLNNGTFPQQPQGGSMYPVPPLASPKYPLPQYKPGGNAGNSGHIGMPGGYGPYGSTPAGYNPGSATTAGNSASNEDLGPAQFG